MHADLDSNMYARTHYPRNCVAVIVIFFSFQFPSRGVFRFERLLLHTAVLVVHVVHVDRRVNYCEKRRVSRLCLLTRFRGLWTVVGSSTTYWTPLAVIAVAGSG